MNCLQLDMQFRIVICYNIFHCVLCDIVCSTMKVYEEEARPYKTRLFQSMFDSLASNKSNEIPVVVEVGMGTFPNSPYLSQSLQTSGLKGLDMIGVDPNDSIKQYAVEMQRNRDYCARVNQYH